jgi:ferredoxin
MKEETESRTTASEESAFSATTESNSAMASSSYEKPGGLAIDFHSAEFNRIDDLNDYSGNYRSFETLDGLITADQRHQMERRRRRETVDPTANEATPPNQIEMESTEVETVEAMPPLTILSRGRTLIIDTDGERALACAKILSEKQMVCTTLLVTESVPAGTFFPRLSRPANLEVNDASVAGAFGGFSATVTKDGGRKPLSQWLGEEAAAFDLVLDLQATLSFAGDCLPAGYYAPQVGSTKLDEAMAELPEMRGRFKKPQFISFQKTRCFHGRSRIRECRQCLDICPVGAIQSTDRKISINHYVCQGCGGCALICPADAMLMLQQPERELLNDLQGKLRDLLVKGGTPSVHPLTLIISDSAPVNGKLLPAAHERDHGYELHFTVEQITSVRLEVLLAALAYGAGKILVECGSQNPTGIKKSSERQVQMARSIVQGLGLPSTKIRFTQIPSEGSDSEDIIPCALGPALEAGNSFFAPATFSPHRERRTLVRLATQHLYDQVGAREPRLPMPAGSPFGAVVVEAALCTLCMACASVCPSGALSAGGNVPRLAFRESQCHQCGLCAEACPEHAIALLPSLLCDLEAVETEVTLREDEALRCVECGVPFGSQVMIDRIKEKLTGHWMYANERQLRRLQMCRTCRTRDALTSQDMNVWNR